ncbi:unnamed protein product [Sphenostylis stenocarpa]|uniref:Uncharacterized protein n=1 Tax=Sphenostylis stenocarpa TaxID=92480 RepID=A0AA87B6T9_9FABA|nr:unnamed protein product [Sphenostylis stenocarpa]
MANKYLALLLVVCLIAAASVDAQESKCLHNCLQYECSNDTTWCRFICMYACLGAGLSKQGAPAAAPLPSRKVKETMQELH